MACRAPTPQRACARSFRRLGPSSRRLFSEPAPFASGLRQRRRRTPAQGIHADDVPQGTEPAGCLRIMWVLVVRRPSPPSPTDDTRAALLSGGGARPIRRPHFGSASDTIQVRASACWARWVESGKIASGQRNFIALRAVYLLRSIARRPIIHPDYALENDEKPPPVVGGPWVSLAVLALLALAVGLPFFRTGTPVPSMRADGPSIPTPAPGHH
jgi:hypothetical protein